MFTFIKKILFPTTKENSTQSEILRQVKIGTVIPDSYISKSGAIVRRMLIINPDFTVCAERLCDRSRPSDAQVHYHLRADSAGRVVYATHSDVDKFAHTVYNKMYKMCEKSKKKGR